MKAYRSKIALVAWMGLFAGISCGDGGTTSTTGGAATTSGTGGASTSSSTSGGPSTGTGGSTTSATTTSATTTTTTSSTSSSTGTGAMYGTCAPPCMIAADCCAPGDPGCPTNTYPKNPTCVSGACKSPQCATTADCTAENPKLDCFALGGENSCAFACTLLPKDDCNLPQTCSGKDDNGKMFCLSMGSGCKDDAFCKGLGLGKCVVGVCSCEADTDCTKPGFSKCSK